MPEIKSYHDLQYDEVSNAPICISHIENEVHDGKHFQTHLRTPILADEAVVEMYFKVPDTAVRLHCVTAFTSELAAYCSVRGSATVSLSGSVLTIFNTDRNSTNASTAHARSSPTLTASGTRIDALDIGGGKKGETGGFSGSHVA